MKVTGKPANWTEVRPSWYIKDGNLVVLLQDHGSKEDIKVELTLDEINVEMAKIVKERVNTIAKRKKDDR